MSTSAMNFIRGNRMCVHCEADTQATHSSTTLQQPQTHTHTRLMALCPGLPGWASTRKVKPRDSEWQWHQLSRMQICISLQTITMTAPHHSVFYRPDALPAAQPTASKQCRHYSSHKVMKILRCKLLLKINTCFYVCEIYKCCDHC